MTDGLDPRLEARLARLGEDGARGDWLDVERRSRALAPRRSRRPPFALLAAAVAVALLAAIRALGLDERLRGVFAVSDEQPAELPSPPDPGTPAAREDVSRLPYAYGVELHGVPGGPPRLAARVFSPLRGIVRGLAVPSPDGR